MARERTDAPRINGNSFWKAALIKRHWVHLESILTD